jgi:serine/threonine-protein kinase
VLPLDARGRAVGALLKDRYEFLGFLGQGGFAAVYQVRNLRLDRVEALKVLREDRGSDSRFAARFEREARIAASLEHPHIVRIYAFGNDGGTLWYSMQFVDGPTLRTQLARHGRMRAEVAAAVFIPLLGALEVIHRAGLVHRDVKPDNIILDSDRRPSLMDFGIVKVDDDGARTAAGTVMGSPNYVSPEQARGRPLDGRSDLYSLGITLYEALSGEVPFAADDNLARMTRRVLEDAPPPSRRVPDLDPEMDAIVLRALTREPENRYPSAAAMRADLEAFLAKDDARLAPAPKPAAEAAPAPAVPRSRAGGFALAAAALLAAGVAAVFAFRSRTRADAPVLPAASPGPFAASATPSPVASEATSPPAAARGTLVEPAPASTPPRRTERAREPEPVLPRMKMPPDVVSEAPVVLPPELESACRGRTVGINVTIGEDGGVRRSRVLTPPAPGCDEVALETVSRYRFRPARDAMDRPMEARLSLSVMF